MFSKIAILGPGLLGASLMQAVRARGLSSHLAAWSRSAGTRAGCAGKPWCDSVHETPADCVRGAALVVVCVPADKIAGTLALAAPGLGAGTLVTDVGSTKEQVCEAVRGVLPEGVTFVGAHPMAGSEKSGLEYARADLFAGRVCIITPQETPPAPPEAVEAVMRFWAAVGMRVVTLAPEVHDEVVAHTSHLPHLAAVALSVLLQRKPLEWRGLGGPGLRDTTRVAAGDPPMWRAIVQENQRQILRVLVDYQAELEELRSAIAAGDFDAVQAFLAAGKNWREQLDGDALSLPAIG